ncbi:MAG: hypothetical protein IKF71_03090 [Bacilli bacterium]|nr:hypothetical protein [Bacilli bacterium]
MPSKKIYIILFIMLLTFGIVMFIFYGIPNIREENIEGTFIVGDNTTWVLREKNWSFLRYTSSMDSYSWQTFHVFEDNNYKGDYYLWHDDKWYVFDEKKEAINLSGRLFAYNSNVDLKVFDFQESKIDDYSFVYEVLNENGISSSSQFTSSYKVSLDFDGDSIEEDFYIISNALPIDFEPETTFSIAFMVKNNVIYPLYTDVSSNKGLNGCKPFYHTFVDTNYDGVSEVILSCGKFSATDQVDMLFQFYDERFNLLISNQ